MLLSEKTQHEIIDAANGLPLSEIGMLYVYIAHLIPGIRNNIFRKMLAALRVKYTSEDRQKNCEALANRSILYFHSSGAITPVHSLPPATIKRWAQDKVLKYFALSCVQMVAKDFHQIPHIEHEFFSYPQIARVLIVSGCHIAAWKLIDKATTEAPETFDGARNIPFNTYKKVKLYADISGEPLNALEKVPATLRQIFLPTLYRNTALSYLPNLLSEQEISARRPVRHDCQDDISDVALHIALQTGQWYIFEQFKKLPNASYHGERLSYGHYLPTHQITLNLNNLCDILKEWRKGKWAALKKITGLVHYNADNIAYCSTADVDLAIRAVLAPLLIIMRFKIPKTQYNHVAQAIDALSESNKAVSSNFVANASAAFDLTPQTYLSHKWRVSHPIDLLPKALCLASMDGLPAITEAEVAEMHEACVALHAAGLTLYSWYMANAMLCIPILKPEQHSELEAIMKSRNDLPRFCNVTPKNSIYDSLLDSMQSLLSPSAESSPSAPPGYISWKLTYRKSTGTVDFVSVFAHKRLKSGKFSIGKKIDCDAMHEEPVVNYLAEQDLALRNCLMKNDDARYWETEFRVTPEIAKLLCGHPHVYLVTNRSETRIELSAESPTLTVKRKKGVLELELQQYPRYDGIPIRRIDDQHYAIFTVNAKAVGLYKMFSDVGDSDKKITFPEQYQDRLLSILSGFTDMVTLKGDIMSQKATRLTAQPKMIAFLATGKGMLSGQLMLEVYPDTAPVAYDSKEKLLFAQIKGKSACIQRDSAQEDQLRQQLMSNCPTLCGVMDDSGYWQIELSDSMLRLVEELQHCPADLLETRWEEGNKLSVSAIDDFKAFNIKASSSSKNWLSIGGEVQVNEGLVLQLSVLLNQINNSPGHFIELTEGHFLKLSRNIEEQLRAISALSAPAPKGKRVAKSVEISPALMMMLAQTNEVQNLPAALQDKATELLEKYNGSFYKPRNLNASLRDYQTEGYEWMQRLMNCGLGACLADDMGLGKTLQVLCVLLARAVDGPSLVVAPASVCNNWSTEAAKFTPTLNVYQLENDNRTELIKKLGKRDVLVCSYGLLVTESELLGEAKWNVVVLDEAQYIKNSQTQRARAACDLKAKCRIAATGTPIENSLDELRSIFDFINPGYLGSQEQFRARFANNPARRKLLRRIVAPFVMRRLKGDVLDELPEKTETTRSIVLNESERALYEACRREALQKAQQTEDRFTILSQLMRMRRLCCHPQLVDEQWSAEAGKMTALAEMAEELRDSGHKALIFSQFTDMLALVRKMFDEQGFSYLYLDGSTPKAKRGGLVDAFQNGEADFFLISLKAGGTGLNLTAADYVILLDPWWNPAVESQAADRTHRIGQKRAVTVCRFVCKDTIEERVMELHAEKRELFDQVINDTGKASPLTINELRQLM